MSTAKESHCGLVPVRWLGSDSRFRLWPTPPLRARCPPWRQLLGNPLAPAKLSPPPRLASRGRPRRDDSAPRRSSGEVASPPSLGRVRGRTLEPPLGSTLADRSPR